MQPLLNYFFMPCLFLIAGVLLGNGNIQAQQADRELPQKIDLSAAISLALAKNFAVQIERIDVEIAGKQVESAKGAYDPNFQADYISSVNKSTPDSLDTRSEFDSLVTRLNGNLSSGANYTLTLANDESRFSSEDFLSNYEADASIRLRQPLLRNFRIDNTRFNIRVAQKGSQIADWDYRNQLINTVTQTINAYSNLNFAQANLDVVIKSRELAEILVNDNRKRVELGRMAESNIITAESQLKFREERVLFAERLLKESQNQLKLLISDEIEALINWNIEALPLATPSYRETNPATDYAIALENRPDYQQALLGHDIDALTARNRKNQALPSLDLTYSYALQGSGDDFEQSFRQLGVQNDDAYSVGAVFSLPLGNRTRRAQAKVAQMELQQTEINLERQKQFILVSLDSAAYRVEKSWERIQVSKSTRELAEKSLEAEEKKLKAGTGFTFRVLDLQTELANAQVGELQAIADYYRDLAEYDRQTGATLDHHNISVD
ncbi:MAG: TolC family protein [Verrucomicrobiota bacterium]